MAFEFSNPFSRIVNVSWNSFIAIETSLSGTLTSWPEQSCSSPTRNGDTTPNWLALSVKGSTGAYHGSGGGWDATKKIYGIRRWVTDHWETPSAGDYELSMPDASTMVLAGYGLLEKGNIGGVDGMLSPGSIIAPPSNKVFVPDGSGNLFDQGTDIGVQFNDLVTLTGPTECTSFFDWLGAHYLTRLYDPAATETAYVAYPINSIALTYKGKPWKPVATKQTHGDHYRVWILFRPGTPS